MRCGTDDRSSRPAPAPCAPARAGGHRREGHSSLTDRTALDYVVADAGGNGQQPPGLAELGWCDEGTSQVKRVGSIPRVKASPNGKGVVSHAGVGLLREMAQCTGLTSGITGALLDTYRGVPVHAPGRVCCDLAVAVADGADAISGIAVLGGRQELPGPVASPPTTWRVLDRVDAGHLAGVRAGAGVGCWCRA